MGEDENAGHGETTQVEQAAEEEKCCMASGQTARVVEVACEKEKTSIASVQFGMFCDICSCKL